MGFKQFAVEKFYQLLLAKGVKCPSCREEIDLPRQIPEEGLSASINCKKCSWYGRLDDIGHDDRYLVEPLTDQPKNSSVIKEVTDGGVSWIVPSTKKPNFLWFFAGFWLTVSFIITTGFLFSPEIDIFGILFMIPFLGVGIGVLFAGLWMSYSKFSIHVENEKVTLKHVFFSWVREKSLAFEEVRAVKIYTSYSKNNRPVKAVKIESFDNKKTDLKFGSQMKDEDKSWLIHELSVACKVQKVSYSSKKGEAKKNTGYSDIVTKKLTVESLGDSGFRVALKKSAGLPLLVVGLIAIGISGFLLLQGVIQLKNLNTGEESNKVVPMLIGLGVSFVGFVLAGFGIKFLGLKFIYTFQDENLTLERKRFENDVSRKLYHRDNFHDVMVKNSGSVNDDPRYSLVLSFRDKKIKPLKLLSFSPREHVDGLEARIKCWLDSSISNEENVPELTDREGISGYGSYSTLD